MTAINNYSTYTELMKNGFYDKLFFADKLLYDWNSLLDYGCADGFLTRMIAEAFPTKEIYGYDNDPNMIVKAQMASDYGTPGFSDGLHKNTHFSWSLEKNPEIDTLFLSSVLHELYSYKTKEEIENFWKFAFESNFKYIVIRDMIPNIEKPNGQTPVTLYKNVRTYCRTHYIEKHLHDFEANFGSIGFYGNCLHFMLKYKYTETANWEREVSENYFSFSMNDLLKIIPENYRIEHQENYTLPFNKWQWENDFGMFIDEKIHSKIILRKIS